MGDALKDKRKEQGINKTSRIIYLNRRRLWINGEKPLEYGSDI